MFSPDRVEWQDVQDLEFGESLAWQGDDGGAGGPLQQLDVVGVGGVHQSQLIRTLGLVDGTKLERGRRGRCSS